MSRDTREQETQAAAPGKRLAVVVGTNQTATLVPPPLELAVADAEAMAEVLQQRCHFELFTPPMLGVQATSAAVKRAVLRLARDRAPEDVILFYFSGHGIQVHDAMRPDVRNTYLGTSDFDTCDVDDDPSFHITLHWLRDKLFQNNEAGQVVIILDCCYAEDIRTGSDHTLDDLREKMAYYFEIPGAEAGKRQSGLRVALAATGYDQTAREQGEHGIMTGLMLQGLRGEVSAIVGEKGEISLSRLAEYLVRQLSPEQKPAIFSSNATGQECVLAHYPELVSLVYLPRSGPDRPTTYIPFPHDPLFQGRSEDFDRLEQLLDGTSIKEMQTRLGMVGITGPGGVGKTQLAVELVYRFLDQQRYPGGIFWTQVGGKSRADWEEQFAVLATETGYLPPDDDPASPENTARRARHLSHYLADHVDVLLILDNVEEPVLITTLLPAMAGRNVRCTILYTSRVNMTLPGMTTYLVNPLPEKAALRLLLQTTRPDLLAETLEDGQRAELISAQNVCQRVGYLPLALVHLRSLLTQDRQISLVRLDDVLREQGMQGLPGQAEAPTTTFSLSWERVRTEEARRLFLLASCFSEAAPVPLWLLGLAAGLGEQNDILEPLGRARLHLQELSLLEELSSQLVRLHPLVREFARQLIKEAGKQGETLMEEARQRLVDVCTLNWLEQRARSEGYWVLLERVRTMRAYSDLLVIGERSPTPTSIHALERWLDRESYLLAKESWWPDKLSWLFYQQLFNRAVETDYVLSAQTAGTPPIRWLRQMKSAHADDHALLRLFAGHTSAVTGVAFSPDGKLVLTGSSDGTARLWDRESARELRRLQGHTSSITSVAFSPDGKRVLIGSGDRTARLWDWESARELARLQGHTSRVRSVAFSPDGKQLLTGSSDGTARLWDCESAHELACLQGHTDWVTSVAFSPDGKQLLTGSSDKTARLWDRESTRELARLQGHTDLVTNVAFSPDGKQLLTGSGDETVRLWDRDSMRELARLQGHTSGVWSVAFSPDGQLMMTGSEDGTIRLWDRESTRELARLQGHTSIVRSVAFSPDGKLALTGSGDGTARLWDWESARERISPPEHTSSVTSVAFSPDGKQLLTGSRDRIACLWDRESTREIARLQGHTGWITSVAFSPDGKQLLTGSGDGTARLWDWESAHELARVRLPGLTDWVRSVAISPDGLQLLAGSSDGTARLWDSHAAIELACMQGHTDWVTSVAFSPDGKQILTGSNDRTARLWDRNTARELGRLQGHANWVTSVAFSPDGKQVLTGSDDGTARLWDSSTARELACLRGHTSGVRCIAFSPDGQIAFTCDANGWVFFWQLSQSAYGTLADLYVAHYEVGAIYWENANHLFLADTGGPGGRPHSYDLSLEGINREGNNKQP